MTDVEVVGGKNASLGEMIGALSALGVRDEDLQGLAQLIQQNPTPVRATGNPVMDDLLRHMGLIK
jgi:hypothetical protein